MESKAGRKKRVKIFLVSRNSLHDVNHVARGCSTDDTKVFCFFREGEYMVVEGQSRDKFGIEYKLGILVLGKDQQFCLVMDQLYLVLAAILFGKEEKVVKAVDVVGEEHSIVSESDTGDDPVPDGDS